MGKRKFDVCVLVRVRKEDKQKAKDYAKSKKVSLSRLVRQHIEKIGRGEVKVYAEFDIKEAGRYVLIPAVSKEMRSVIKGVLPANVNGE